MSTNFYPVGLIFILLFSACQNSSKNNTSGFGQLEFESFTIDCQTDTTIEAKNGVQLIISSNTFDCATKDAIEIKFKSALKVSEMLQAGLHTMAENARPLESGGMFFLEVTSGQNAAANNPIIVRVPTKFTQEDMQVFEQKEDGNWKESTIALIISNKKRLQLGRRLFLENCASCHNMQLDLEMTGPALGNIDDYRDRAWLIQFTRNSTVLIEARDSIAACLYNIWNNAQMTHFDSLNDNEINAIYDWIANKSKAERLKNGDNLEGVACDLQAINQVWFDTTNIGVRDFPFMPNTGSTYYTIGVNNRFGWYNIDQYWNKYPPITIPNLSIESESSASSTVHAFLVLKESKTITPFIKGEKNVWHIFENATQKKISFPTDEPAAILVYQTNTTNRAVTHYYMQDYALSDQTKELTIPLAPIQNKKFLQLLQQQFD